MKKIVSYIGSHRGQKSGTAQLAEKMCEKAGAVCDTQVTWEIMTSDQLQLQACRGCCDCFRTGSCLLDREDDGGLMKEKLLEADFVILGSPVYALQVSGQTKTLIDRLSYWLHLFRLAGKPGIALTTTSSSGEAEVLGYLIRVMAYMGVRVVGGYSVFTQFPGVFQNPKDVERKAELGGTVISQYLSGEKRLVSNDRLENLFHGMKESIIRGRVMKPAEYRFWEEHGYFSHESYQSLMDAIAANTHVPGGSR
ncbi:flavodoxin family protein [Anoxynatronum buryatiense]|uniref:Multimeric flavodoxin WrbA n=1 Tax=Anoxynatronum buryatiense TaxID=489973 RepID=A0AA45WW77_9CLOT|nr:flavodoxin family protein [Anoxynatronum buryatiense]SMP57951.1 Multimeric flavodoxin WrbA [Anoxynatronum buryatiense]